MLLLAIGAFVASVGGVASLVYYGVHEGRLAEEAAQERRFYLLKQHLDDKGEAAYILAQRNGMTFEGVLTHVDKERETFDVQVQEQTKRGSRVRTATYELDLYDEYEKDGVWLVYDVEEEDVGEEEEEEEKNTTSVQGFGA